MKLTKRDMFTMLLDIVNTVDLPDYAVDGETPAPTREDFSAFLEKQIDQLNKKGSGSRKPTAQQVQNEEFKSLILETLKAHDRPMRIKEIQEATPELEDVSNQRMSHLLSAMIKVEQVTKTYEKKVPYYSACV